MSKELSRKHFRHIPDNIVARFREDISSVDLITLALFARELMRQRYYDVDLLMSLSAHLTGDLLPASNLSE